MKLRLPNYYKNFKCIADKCKNSCCSAGWEIDIDEKTAEIYKKTTGKFGEKLNKNIEKNQDSNTYHFTLNSNNKCPFFNKSGLCDIYTNLGEKNLCQICTEHPRYYEWFNGLKEGGIGLCCEEACRIIMCNTEKFGTYEIDIPDEEYDEYDQEIFDYLLMTRDKIFNYISSTSKPLNIRIYSVLWYGYMIQQNLDYELLDDEDIIEITESNNNTSSLNSQLNEFLKYIISLEFNDKNWQNELKNYLESPISLDKFEKFKKSIPEINQYLINIYNYFIWRYYMKGCFENEILSKIKTATISIIIIQYLWYCKWLQSGELTLENMVDIVRKYSEEIEYSEENLFNIAQATYDLNIFSVDNLLNISM